jgi:hypothetical protein
MYLEIGSLQDIQIATNLAKRKVHNRRVIKPRTLVFDCLHAHLAQPLLTHLPRWRYFLSTVRVATIINVSRCKQVLQVGAPP